MTGNKKLIPNFDYLRFLFNRLLIIWPKGTICWIQVIYEEWKAIKVKYKHNTLKTMSKDNMWLWNDDIHSWVIFGMQTECIDHWRTRSLIHIEQNRIIKKMMLVRGKARTWCQFLQDKHVTITPFPKKVVPKFWFTLFFVFVLSLYIG